MGEVGTDRGAIMMNIERRERGHRAIVWGSVVMMVFLTTAVLLTYAGQYWIGAGSGLNPAVIFVVIFGIGAFAGFLLLIYGMVETVRGGRDDYPTGRDWPT